MDLIRKYFPELTDDQLLKIENLSHLALEWNSKINLLSRKDSEHIFERHILHSLAVYKIFPFPPGSSVADAGTGGGYPGIPLAIANPDSRFCLVDSIGKKIKAVENIVERLELKNCEARQARIENLNSNFHFIVSRAVTNFPDFYRLVEKKIRKKHINPQFKNGIIYLKGGDFDNEIRTFIPGKIQVKEIRDYFSEEFFVTKKIIYLPFF